VIVAKGKKVSEFKPAGKAGKDVVDAMLGPTGNLRAPVLRTGKTLLVGFHEETYQQVFG
jgi:arsenate reductase-like glutaredoxin family protein